MRFFARFSALSLLVACLAVGSRSLAQASRGSVPAWVVPVAAPEPRASHEGDTESLLHDEQVRLESDHTVSFMHRAYAVRSAAGVQSSSELSVERASDEVVTWHFVRRHRGGVSTELLPKLEIKVIQPESRLGEGIYDGARKDVIFLEDVRVGDVIEYAYSLTSSTEILGKRFSESYWLGRTYPLRRLELRVWWPESRNVAVRAFGASVGRPSSHELKYVGNDVPELKSEPREPKWFNASPRLELSEFASWAEVVAWALPHYVLPVPPEVEAKAQSFRGASSDRERMAQALRFVQDEVRYLGLEEGIRALVPHPPAQVLERRFGDCKDKALLLVLLLRALGFEADPALVNTDWERGVEHMLPTPGAFNHLIVRTELGDQELWFDATSSYERGPVTTPRDIPYGRALVLRAGETGLRTITQVAPREIEQEIRELFTLSGEGAATLHVHTIYRGSAANSMRARFAEDTRADMQKRYLDFYAKAYGELKVRAPLELEDDEQANTVSVSEHYTLREFWKDEQQSVRAWSLEDFFPTPEASRLPRPYSLHHPARVRHVVELYNRSGWNTRSKVASVKGKFFEYTVHSGPRGDSEIIEHDFVSKVDHVPAADLPAYVREAQRALDQLESSYITGKKALDEGDDNFFLGLLAFLVVGLMVWGLWAGMRRVRRTSRKRRFEKKRKFSPGEAPESAIPVRDLEHARTLLHRVECCDQRLFSATELRSSEVRYGDGLLTVYKQACQSCSRAHARYFSLRGDTAAPR